MISSSYTKTSIEEGPAARHGDVGRGRNRAEQRRAQIQPWLSGRRNIPRPGTPGESRACRAPLWGQDTTGQAVLDGGRMEGNQNGLQDLPVVSSSSSRKKANQTCLILHLKRRRTGDQATLSSSFIPESFLGEGDKAPGDQWGEAALVRVPSMSLGFLQGLPNALSLSPEVLVHPLTLGHSMPGYSTHGC